MKPTTLPSATVEVIAQGAPHKKLSLEPQGDALISTEKIPDGDGYQFGVRVRPSADAKYKNFRFFYDTSMCGGCQIIEYACVCAGH